MFLDWKETSWYLCLSSVEETTQRENRFCRESCWESESCTELLRPGGRGREMVAILASLQSRHCITFMGMLSVFSLGGKKKKRMGWGTFYISLSASTTLYSVLGNTGIHACIHSNWKGFFYIVPHKLISHSFLFLQCELAKWWTGSIPVKVSTCAHYQQDLSPLLYAHVSSLWLFLLS